jgi:hypothetical protein
MGGGAGSPCVLHILIPYDIDGILHESIPHVIFVAIAYDMDCILRVLLPCMILIPYDVCLA